MGRSATCCSIEPDGSLGHLDPLIVLLLSPNDGVRDLSLLLECVGEHGLCVLIILSEVLWVGVRIATVGTKVRGGRGAIRQLSRFRTISPSLNEVLNLLEGLLLKQLESLASEPDIGRILVRKVDEFALSCESLSLQLGGTIGNTIVEGLKGGCDSAHEHSEDNKAHLLHA